MSEFNFNCPHCGQPIAAPSAPAKAAGVIQIKTATLRTAALIALGVLLVAGMVLGGLSLFAGHHSVTFKAYVDGADIVHLRGRSLWIEHLDFQLPGRISVNGRKWNPRWDSNTSDRLFLGVLTRPVKGTAVKLAKRIGRGEVSVVELPSPENQGTLSIKVDDGPFSGADWYEFTVTW